MTALSEKRRKRTLLMLAGNVVAVAVLVGLVLFGRDALGEYTAAKRADSGLRVDAIPATPSAAFATVDGENVLTSVTVFVVSPSLSGGSIVPVPVNADSSYGLGEQRLSLQQAYADGGPEGLTAAVEGLLSMTLDFTAVDDPAKAAGVLIGLAPIDVDLPRTVVSDATGATEVLFNRGVRALSAGEAVQVLTARSATVDEEGRRANVEAVWAGVAASIGQGRPGAALTPTIASFGDVVAHLIAGPVGTRGLPVLPLDPAVPNPDDADLVVLDRSEEILVFASLAPGNMSAPANGLSYRIVAPPGSEERVKAVVSVLLYAGNNVTSIDLTATPREKTELHLYDDSVTAETDKLKPVLGEFTYGTPSSRVQSAEAAILLGADFLDSTAPVATIPPPTTEATETPVASDSVVATSASVGG